MSIKFKAVFSSMFAENKEGKYEFCHPDILQETADTYLQEMTGNPLKKAIKLSHSPLYKESLNDSEYADVCEQLCLYAESVNKNKGQAFRPVALPIVYTDSRAVTDAGFGDLLPKIEQLAKYLSYFGKDFVRFSIVLETYISSYEELRIKQSDKKLHEIITKENHIACPYCRKDISLRYNRLNTCTKCGCKVLDVCIPNSYSLEMSEFADRCHLNSVYDSFRFEMQQYIIKDGKERGISEEAAKDIAGKICVFQWAIGIPYEDEKGE